MEKISWTNVLKNEKVIDRESEEINALLTIKKGKSKWVSHNLCRNCLVRHAIEGEIKGWEDEEENLRYYWMTLKETKKYCIWKKNVLDGIMWITRFERGYGSVARQTGHRIYVGYYLFVLNFQRYAICRHETEVVVRQPGCYFTVHKNFDFNSSYTLLQDTFTKCCFRGLRFAIVTSAL